MRILFFSFFSLFAFFSLKADSEGPSATAEQTPPPPQTQPVAQPTEQPKVFQSFSAKISANKVRLRLQPNTESTIIRQLNKNDLVLVIGEEGNFWKVAPPLDFKAYVFKSYILDEIVEANRVNIRLKPDLESPIIGQLDNGEKIENSPLSSNSKWLEIKLPERFQFFIAKEFVAYAASADLFASLCKKKEEGKKLLDEAYFITQAECKKSFELMAPQEAVQKFDTILKEYAEFSEYVDQAKEGLALLQDNYLQKKIAALECTAPSPNETVKDELASSLAKDAENASLSDFSKNPKTPTLQEPNLWGKGKKDASTSKMNDWKAPENSLFLAWEAFHPGKKIDAFYKEQEANSIHLQGVIEPYQETMKNKPGDYVLKNGELPVAYLYSTQVDLESLVGKTVSLTVSSRPNYNFAFPAYFVISIEE